MKTFHFKNLIKIEHNGLTYKNDDGNNCFIDFNECLINWGKKAKEEFNQEVNLNESKCVGERDITARPAYIEFYTNEPIRCIFPMNRKFYQKLFNFPSSEINNFLKIQFKIFDLGYRLFDLS